MHTPGKIKPRKGNYSQSPMIQKPLTGSYKTPKLTPKKLKADLPKASLGTIVKGVKSLFGIGSKIAKTTKKVIKPVKKAGKAYGEKKAYGRLSDMKKSEFYRDRHNAGKVFNAPGNNKAKAIASVGTAAGLGAAAMAQNKSKSTTTPKKK